MMHKPLAIAAFAAAVGLGAAAQADMLSGGPVYGGPASVSGTVTCRVFNFGVFPVTIGLRQIFNNAGGLAALNSDSCGVSLASTKTCQFSAPITGNFAFSCRIFESGNDGNVSGVAEIQAPNHSVLNTVPLQR
jgi:hypothetical protein